MIMARRKQADVIKGQAAHRRTENDYMGILLDTVSLDDWRDVIDATLQGAKASDAGARAWLAHYLIGKPQSSAPTPMNVVVQQWSGDDPLVKQLAQPLINSTLYPSLHADDDFERNVRDLIAAELAKKLPDPDSGDMG
jgi:hypothetical protein